MAKLINYSEIQGKGLDFSEVLDHVGCGNISETWIPESYLNSKTIPLSDSLRLIAERLEAEGIPCEDLPVKMKEVADKIDSVKVEDESKTLQEEASSMAGHNPIFGEPTGVLDE